MLAKLLEASHLSAKLGYHRPEKQKEHPAWDPTTTSHWCLEIIFNCIIWLFSSPPESFCYRGIHGCKNILIHHPRHRWIRISPFLKVCKKLLLFFFFWHDDFICAKARENNAATVFEVLQNLGQEIPLLNFSVRCNFLCIGIRFQWKDYHCLCYNHISEVRIGKKKGQELRRSMILANS